MIPRLMSNKEREPYTPFHSNQPPTNPPGYRLISGARAERRVVTVSSGRTSSFQRILVVGLVDRKSTRLKSSDGTISYGGSCLIKQNRERNIRMPLALS